MAILKFRVYLEEDETIYRDILIKHTQTFLELHTTILQSFEFDSKHQATFYRSNDNWQHGREISLAQYEKTYKAPPLIMGETAIGDEIHSPNQKFIYVYDFDKNWVFLVELISVAKSENPKLMYPTIGRKEGVSPLQYGTRGLLGPKFTDVEEKYDLTDTAEEEEEETAGLDDFASDDE